MLSDEERKALKELTEIKELVEEDLKYEDYEVTATLDQIDLESLVIALNLIEKQQKEIEELKEERKKYPIAMNDEQYKKVIEFAQKDIKEELDRQINVRMINEEYIERNYISKDQIKAKIEELENQKRQWIEDRDNKHKDSEIIYAIEVLQSLLEKE